MYLHEYVYLSGSRVTLICANLYLFTYRDCLVILDDNEQCGAKLIRCIHVVGLCCHFFDDKFFNIVSA